MLMFRTFIHLIFLLGCVDLLNRPEEHIDSSQFGDNEDLASEGMLKRMPGHGETSVG